MDGLSRKCPKLALVVPCYNEEEVLIATSDRLGNFMESLIEKKLIAADSYICFVDDGSCDLTWTLIQNKSVASCRFRGIKLSRNFGHQNALMAGLMGVKDTCDCAISIDADLQQDENAIPLFLEKYAAGCEIVYGIRENRDTDGFMKKATALAFYRLMSAMGVSILRNHADYRLLGSKALSVLAQYPEKNMFLRGVLASLGFKTDTVHFEVKERFAGNSKYDARKMLGLALDGITSSSTVPLRIATVIGATVFFFSTAMSVFVLYQALIMKDTVPGWASTVLPIYFIGGVQLLTIGVLGEYVGKIYKEVKMRPRYIIEAEA